MVNSATGSRNGDANGLSLMLGDSRHASNNFGFNGSKFANVPKSKFLFFLKFHRVKLDGGVDWYRDVSFAIKTIDRPRISFKTETLNQYNRKRLVQTGHEFEPLQLRFHDTVNPDLRRMFIEYYQYYYGDSKVYGSGGSTVYDVVAAEQFASGSWGFLPPMADQENGYFFSHIEVFQLYGGMFEKFTLINPKITSYNPDDFDYASGGIANEIQMSVEFEGIVFDDIQELTDELATEFGLDRGLYWDVENDLVEGVNPGAALGSNLLQSDPGLIIENAIRRNIGNIVKGDLNTFVGEVTGAFDPTRSLAVGNVGLNSIKNLVSGNRTPGSIRNTLGDLGGLFKGPSSGKPRGIF